MLERENGMDEGDTVTIDDTPRYADEQFGVPSMYSDYPFDIASNGLSARVSKVSRPVSRKLLSQVFGLFRASYAQSTQNSFEIHWHVLSFGCGGGGDRGRSRGKRYLMSSKRLMQWDQAGTYLRQRDNRRSSKAPNAPATVPGLAERGQHS